MGRLGAALALAGLVVALPPPVALRERQALQLKPALLSPVEHLPPEPTNFAESAPADLERVGGDGGGKEGTQTEEDTRDGTEAPSSNEWFGWWAEVPSPYEDVKGASLVDAYRGVVRSVDAQLRALLRRTLSRLGAEFVSCEPKPGPKDPAPAGVVAAS